MNNNLGFGANHHSIDHNGHPNNTNNATATSLHPYHASNNNNAFYHNNNNNHHHQGYHGQQNYTSQHGHNTNGNNHAYHNDLQKTIPIQNQVDIYQPPHQSLDSDLMNPIVNRQLNNQYASNYHNYHQQHYSPSQHPSYHYNNNETNNDSNSAATREEPQQADQPRSNASTPTPTLTSSLSTVSSASTPSLSSNTLSLQGNNDYTYNNNNRQTSPASSIATTSSTFHVPASPEQLAMGTHLPSPLASHNVNMTQQQTMPAWTANNGSCVDPELSSQQQQQSMSPREHVSFNGNASPKNDRPYYPTTTAQPAAHLYSAPQDHQQQQMWVTSMPSDASQDILEQDRHHQRSYSQSSRNSSALGSYNNDGHGHNQPSVASQPTLPAMGGLPLLSPTSMLQSDYQPSSYPMNIHETPTVMSHTDYPSVNSSNNNNNESRYGPIRTAHKKSSSRPGSIGSQRDFNTRTRTNSLNSTSSASSNGALSNLTNTLGTASLAASAASAAPSSLTLTTTHEQDEDEDSDSPTTIQIRPRINATPRKAVAARVFECSVPGCNKAYTQLHNLKSHERTGHTPVIKLKPFLCIIEGCTKAFSQRKSLASHIKTAHADFKFKPFKCSQDGCQKSYTQLHNLRTHEKTVHMVDLSRKRVKNPSMGGGMVGLGGLGPSSSCSPPFNSLDIKAHHHQQHHQQHHHQGQMSYHSGLGLGYDGLSDLDLGHGAATGHPEDAYHYQRQHDQQHHHQAYSRMPHLNPMAGMYSR
ncbi:hypothetical protein BGZ46_002544 [Entomortierella lignicola]|nr:hypothetical protein BGZ46_002544 [Entomortierella lignicola]